jgi:hypothetical protein
MSDRHRGNAADAALPVEIPTPGTPDAHTYFYLRNHPRKACQRMKKTTHIASQHEKIINRNA